MIKSFDKRMKDLKLGYFSWVIVFCCLMPIVAMLFANILGKISFRLSASLQLFLGLFALGAAIFGPYCLYPSMSFVEVLFAFCCWPFYLAQRFSGTCRVKTKYSKK